MSGVFPFKEFEPRWQEFWLSNKVFKTEKDLGKLKYYVLEMFPYPSGKIHMGHVRNYAIGDVVARYKIMRGFNVIHPMGWDAFGLPAENAAINHGVHPAKWTYENIDFMRSQMKKMGLSYDWDREIATCDPDYYKWEQWLFIRMWEKGLAYKKLSTVNWCPSCQTILANEQVEAGLCWRCESEVIPREIEGWFFKITDYAEELLYWCDLLKGWPERVLTMQKNWIGKSEGAEIDFPIKKSSEKIKIYTTRQDTIYGATFMLLAPEHSLVKQLAKETGREKEAIEFVNRVSHQDKIYRTSIDTGKEGLFTGAYAVNPFTNEDIPIWAANFVLMEYGTGAVMAVPAHDQRDFEFAKKYNLEIRIVIQNPEFALVLKDMDKAYEDDGILVNSGQFTGLVSAEAKKRIVHYAEELGIGKKAVNYKLRDWGISRQRYWGAPIPMVNCDKCGIVPVGDEDLPVLLPMNVNISGKGGSPLAEVESFVNTTCPGCGGNAKRETDTMDTFVESSWYFARFTCSKYDNGILNSDDVNYWMPVDQYIGGIEHAVMHLLYARFYTKILRDMGIIKIDEPFTDLLTQGMVIKDGAKMSKSKGNVVDPDELISTYGADTVRLFSLFASPPEKDLDWSDKGVEGSFRFLNRVWRFVIDHVDEIKNCPDSEVVLEELSVEGRKLWRIVHETIKKVTDDVEDRFHFNTAISAIMEMVNALYQFDSLLVSDRVVAGFNLREEKPLLLKKSIKFLLLLLSPFSPHICEELWHRIGNNSIISLQSWPEYDELALRKDEILIVIQVNGKVRNRIIVEPGLDDEEIKRRTLSSPKTQAWIKEKEIIKIVVIPNKIVNVVVK